MRRSNMRMQTKGGPAKKSLPAKAKSGNADQYKKQATTSRAGAPYTGRLSAGKGVQPTPNAKGVAGRASGAAKRAAAAPNAKGVAGRASGVAARGTAGGNKGEPREKTRLFKKGGSTGKPRGCGIAKRGHGRAK